MSVVRLEAVGLTSLCLAAALTLFLRRFPVHPAAPWVATRQAAECSPAWRYTADRAPAGNDTYAQCLARHGKALDSGNSLRWWDAARRSPTQQQRLDNLAEHVLQTWLWTLRRGEGTPCRPKVLRVRCTNEGGGCAGLGDRLKGLSVAFWLAVLTDSVLLMDMSRPVPLEEFFTPRSPALRFADVRACLDGPLRNKSKDVSKMAYEPCKMTREERGRRDFFAACNEHILAEDIHGAWAGADVVDFWTNVGFVPTYLRHRQLRPTLARYGLDTISLGDLLFISSDMYLQRPSARMRSTAAPLLAALRREQGAVAVGLHLRIGDSALSNAKKKNNVRYPPEALVCFERQVEAQCNAVAPRPCSVYVASDSAAAVSNLTTKLSARNISVVVSDGEALHIDQINATEVSDLAGAAAKTYLDWYMLTQVEALVFSSGGFAVTAAYSSMHRARSVVFMDQTGAQPKDRNCTFTDAIHACKGADCAGQVSQFDKAQTLLRQDWTLGQF